MSAGDEIDVGAIASVDDLRRALRELAGRVDELEAELAAERERRRELEARRGSLEVRAPDDRPPRLEDVVLTGAPGLNDILVGQVLAGRASQDNLEELEDRVESAFEGAVQGEADPDQALPIMQVTRTWQSESRSLNDTQRRAAMVWSEFFEFCDTSQTKHVLRSSEVKKILGAHDENTHRQTRKDVMGLVAELGRQYVATEQVGIENALVIERDHFEEYVAELSQEVRPE